MKTTGSTLAAVLGLVSGATAHYTFDKLLLNDQQVGGDNTYIRRHDNGYMPIKFKEAPQGSISPLDADFACNKGATGAPEVITVKAGDKIGLRQAFLADGIQHPGPSQIYISPVSDAKTDAGSGEWYKIHQSLICRQGSPESLRTDAWCSWNENNVWGVIPSTIPNGQYLLRGEHIGLHGAHDGQAEFYVSCAQIEVTGNDAAGTTIPGESTRFPGGYQPGDAAVNFSVWGRETAYPVAPGPDVIPGGTIRGSADGAGGDELHTVPVQGGFNSDGSSSTGNDANTPSPSSSPSSSPAPTPSAAPGGGANDDSHSGKGKGKCPGAFPRRAAALLAAKMDAQAE
ncbi:glycosyl hydrolase family 61-domain-containing protein [Corynascus similis CBS 632.67]